MKLYCLSSHPNKPCYILRFKEITVMLDCGLSAQTALNFIPLPLVPSSRLANLPGWMPRDSVEPHLEGELKECCGRVFVDSSPEFCPPLANMVDYSEIDIVLISNYSSMLALPFITEKTGFKGVVYATEPTLQIGKLFLEELVEYLEQTPKRNQAKYWKEVLHLLPSPLCDSFRPRSWKRLYSLAKVKSSLSRIKVVGYDEKLDVYGALKVTAVSSGYCLGSSNWVISSDYEKVAYVSGSSTLTTHPRPMDQSVLKNSNVLILTGLTQTPTSNPDSMLGELCVAVAMTLRANGCVLIPCYPSGVVYDIFECLSSYLDNTNLATIPMFFISPVADMSLGYSNILAEWLSNTKQSKVYLPEEPFPHGYLVKMGRLKHYKRIYSEGFSTDFRQPCIVFCGHPSLRFGDAVHFIEQWGSNPLHTVIFTEPDFPYLDALAPFQPLAMKAVHCPIDTSLNFTQANKLIRELKPGTLVVPQAYTQPPPAHAHRSELAIDQESRYVISITRGEVVSLAVKRHTAKVSLCPTLADKILSSEVRPGITLATITAALHVKDNQHNITELPEEPTSKKRKLALKCEEALKSPRYEWGTLDVENFIKRLKQEGINDTKVEHNMGGYIIHLQEEDTVIQIEDSNTHIYCEANDLSLRQKLRTILMQCLNSF
ncbi:integrator complex subunit 9 [Cimex lectularius]|uniref:Beta-Casp domain-containing protein n=1 Tax=Cimex lectularius TaxID=79782 RepID=A0A8I6RI70_CIMLE|nr:integrator complex subunit 9 [Cimex lectularius]